jgi:tetratricopeptide (TPR) repeat protein
LADKLNLPEFEHAQQLIDQGLSNDALAQVERGLLIAPHNVRGLTLKAAILNTLGLLNEARTHYREALDIINADPTIKLVEGNTRSNVAKIYMGLGGSSWRLALLEPSSEHWSQARSAYESALSFNPDIPYAWHGLGVARWNLGLIDAAIDACERSVKLDIAFADLTLDLLNTNGDANDAFTRAADLLGIRDVVHATEQVQAGLALVPDSIWGTVLLANILYEAGKFADACQCSTKAINLLNALEPSHFFADKLSAFRSQIFQSFGNCSFQLAKRDRSRRKWQQTLEAYLTAIEFNRSNPATWYGYGVAAYKLGQYTKGSMALEKALQLKPTQVGAYPKLFWCELRALHISRAFSVVRRYSECLPEGDPGTRVPKRRPPP